MISKRNGDRATPVLMRFGRLLFCVSLLVAACSSAFAAPNDDLLDAARRGDLSAVQIALSSHAKVNAVGLDGNTALNWALYSNQGDVAKFLLGKKANPNIPNQLGIRPLDIAASRGDGELVALLLDRGAIFYADDGRAKLRGPARDLFIAVAKDDQAGTDKALAGGADANTRDSLARTPLHLAAASEKKGATEALLGKGADIGAQDKFGYTPLFYIRSQAVADLLIAHNAKIDEVAKDGSTPLFFAVLFGREEAAKFFIAHGAKLFARNQEGQNPLKVAQTSPFIGDDKLRARLIALLQHAADDAWHADLERSEQTARSDFPKNETDPRLGYWRNECKPTGNAAYIQFRADADLAKIALDDAVLNEFLTYLQTRNRIFCEHASATDAAPISNSWYVNISNAVELQVDAHLNSGATGWKVDDYFKQNRSK